MNSQITVYTLTSIFVRNLIINMAAAIDWCSHTTHDWIWLVSCFWFNGPLRQYFSLSRTVSQRGRKKRKHRRKKKCPNNPDPHLMQAQYAPVLLLSKVVGHTGTESLPGTIAPPDHPLRTGLWRLSLSQSLCLSVSLSLFKFTLVSRKFSKTTL